jgi:hypothetical protein
MKRLKIEVLRTYDNKYIIKSNNPKLPSDFCFGELDLIKTIREMLK